MSLTIGLVNHIEFLNINTFDIEFDSGSIWLFFTWFLDCAIAFDLLRLSALTSGLRYSISIAMISFRTCAMCSKCWSKLIKLCIVVLEQQRTLLSILGVLLFRRPEILFSVISSFSYLLFVLTYNLFVSLATSFTSGNGRGIS